MRFGALATFVVTAIGAMPIVVTLMTLTTAPLSAQWFRQYEYEEEMYLALDGTATLYVNSSLPALNALRGTSFDASRSGRADTEAIRAFYSDPNIRVKRVSQSRRSGRRFVHVRMDVDDVTKLAASAPFAWSTYQFRREGEHFVYEQRVGAAAARHVDAVNWKGNELVAFRMHLPSIIDDHNTPTRTVDRGNILTWEQPLAARLRGEPLVLEAKMRTQSILYTTLWLFGATAVVVAVAFIGVIWWVMRRPAPVDSPQPAR